jgi:antitoxin component YwqK of YwqJK toxin-antitoxin module
MKKLITCIIVVFCLNAIQSQVFLDCKKDLIWDSKEKRYYKKDDQSKIGHTGLAQCSPQKNVINKGNLLNGNWHGTVSGYKGDLLIGYIQFKEGIVHGAEVRFYENGKVKDSMNAVQGNYTYKKTIEYDKKGMLSSILETDFNADTSVLCEFASAISRSFDEQVFLQYTVRKKGNVIHGNQETFEYSEGNGTWNAIPLVSDYYENGVKISTTTYFNGKKELTKELKEGKVVTELRYSTQHGTLIEKTPYKNGKKHGISYFYDENGDVILETRYENGVELGN